MRYLNTECERDINQNNVYLRYDTFLIYFSKNYSYKDYLNLQNDTTTGFHRTASLLRK